MVNTGVSMPIRRILNQLALYLHGKTKILARYSAILIIFFFLITIANEFCYSFAFFVSISIFFLLCRHCLSLGIANRVLNDFLCAKVACPDDMSSTSLLFLQKVLTVTQRIFSRNSLLLSSVWACFCST